MLIRSFTETDTDPVVALWAEAGLLRPWNDPHRDIARKLSLVYYLAVAEEHRGSGFARVLMEEAERLLNDTVIGMYEGLGYATETTVVMCKRLIADEAPDDWRHAAK